MAKNFQFEERNRVWEFDDPGDPCVSMKWVATWGRPYPYNLSIPPPRDPEDVAFFGLHLSSWDSSRKEADDHADYVWRGRAKDISKVSAFRTRKGLMKVLYHGGCLFNGRKAKSLPGLELIEATEKKVPSTGREA